MQKCNACDFASVQTIYLRNQMKTHSGEKMHKCKICNFESVQTVYLRNHLKPFGEKSHKCNACDFDSMRLQIAKMSRRASTANAEGGGLETFKAPHRDPWWPGAIIFYNCNECNFLRSYYTNLTIHDDITINYEG